MTSPFLPSVLKNGSGMLFQCHCLACIKRKEEMFLLILQNDAGKALSIRNVKYKTEVWRHFSLEKFSQETFRFSKFWASENLNLCLNVNFGNFYQKRTTRLLWTSHVRPVTWWACCTLQHFPQACFAAPSRLHPVLEAVQTCSRSTSGTLINTAEWQGHLTYSQAN